ncbi:MAG: methyl-accepting chemotaxis protein [Betaproteobacteria bacterium]|nr:methyl-accepting chemotaxis protein [Betaproteobacteria bacterium]
MKNNQPVTQREYVLKDGVAIISKTDAKGRITWVNQDFIESSGFHETELLGKAHNIVRHPDMPEEAFRDLWATIKSGRPWSAMVKNRRKDGDHYWVRASVTPQDDGGYMSVRQRPSRDDVDTAETLYREMRTGRCAVRLTGGRLLKAGLLGRVGQRLDDLTIASRLWGMAGLALLSILGVGLESWRISGRADASPTALWAIMVVGSLAICAITMWLSRTVVGQLHAITEATRDMARGDLTRRLPHAGGDEFGDLITQLTRTRDNLFEIIYSIGRNAHEVSTAAAQLNESAERAARAVQDQSESASNMAATVEQMSTSIDQVGEHAGIAQRISAESGEVSREGGAVVHDAANEMKHIADAVSSSARTVEELGDCSKEISVIVNVIRDIADQTNLLALNAAIEAARAGEQGRGFAVVADEVRKLSERTGESTRKIAEMVGRIQSGAERATAEMNNSVERVSRGVETAHHAGSSMTRIQDGSGKVGQAVDDIAHTLNEQSVTMQEIARNVENIARMCEENSSVAVNTAQSASRLSNMADALRRDASRFRL